MRDPQPNVSGGELPSGASPRRAPRRVLGAISERLGWRWWWSAEMRYAVLFDRFTLRPMFRFHLNLRDGLSGYK